MNHSSFVELPVAVFAMAPELAAATWPVEERATCASCAVGAPRAQRDRLRPLDKALRCCTYHPTHPNWLVGRALRRGGRGAATVRERLARMDDGVGLTGVTASTATTEIWRQSDPWTLFGQDPDRLCPYFIGEDGCSVWLDRGSVCRTWFCKHTDGPRGQQVWSEAQRVLRSVERRLSAWCIETVEAPTGADAANPQALAAWYIRCADAVDAMPPDVALGLRDAALEARIREMLEALDAHAPPLPDIVGPRVGAIEPWPGGGFIAMALQRLDHTLLPEGIFELLSRLDGQTHWRDAVAGANAAIGADRFDKDLVTMLFRRGLLEARDPNAEGPEPGMTLSIRERSLAAPETPTP